MKIVIVYISPNGTTRRTVRELGTHFSRAGHEFSEFDIGRNGNRELSGVDWNVFKGADLIGIAGPVYHLRLFHTLERFLEGALPRIRALNGTASGDGKSGGIRAFIVITYAGISSGTALLDTARLLRNNGIPLAGAMKVRAPHFWQAEGYPDEETRKLIIAFHDRLRGKDFRPIPWKQVHRELSHRKPVIRLIYPFSGIIGKKRNQPIRINGERCAACGRCVRECPVGAIAMESGDSGDARIFRGASKCAYCYHCVTACPHSAVLCDIEKVKGIVEFNKKIVGLEQPPSRIFV